MKRPTDRLDSTRLECQPLSKWVSVYGAFFSALHSALRTINVRILKQVSLAICFYCAVAVDKWQRAKSAHNKLIFIDISFVAVNVGIGYTSWW